MPPCCICYTTDAGYLFPTLVSAMQARRHSGVTKADVAIYSFGAGAETERVFAKICAAENIRFHAVPLAKIDGASAMLARLFLTRYVPEEYAQFLYIDGDTQITGTLDPLLDHDVPDGHFLAASDPMIFAIPGHNKHDRDISEYLSFIGIPDHEKTNYFNSGVLRINRHGWDEIGLASWALFQKHQSVTRFPDQDALNIIGGAHRLPMSLAWNFPIFMRNADVEPCIKPRIFHFMGSPKPWHGVFQPWSESFYQPYIKVLETYPMLESHFPTMRAMKRLRYVLQQHYKQGLEQFTWRHSIKRKRILDYERGLARLQAPSAA